MLIKDDIIWLWIRKYDAIKLQEKSALETSNFPLRSPTIDECLPAKKEKKKPGRQKFNVFPIVLKLVCPK